MKRFFVFLLLFFITSLTGIAQTDSTMQRDSTNQNYHKIFFTVPFEFPIIDASELNTSLQKAGYPKFTPPLFNWGLGLQVHHNRIIVLASYISNSKIEDNNAFINEVEHSAFIGNIGFNVISDYNVSLYPFAGLRLYELLYTYQEKSKSAGSFEDYLSTTTNYKEISQSQFALDLGVGLSYQTWMQYGVKGGYLLPLGKKSWEINDGGNTLGNSPTVDYKYYITVWFSL